MTRARIVSCCTGVLIMATPAFAHDGPPFPIVSDREAGPYTVSIWTDPDTTDDGTPGGQFWVMIAPRMGASSLAPDTRATVSVRTNEDAGRERSAPASPVQGEASTQFAAIVLDREGVFRVRVAIDGSQGPAAVESEVTATYDLRPSPLAVVVYVVPFVLVGALWGMLLVRRRHGTASAQRRGRYTSSPLP